jgi:hypothetical protein
MRWKHFNQIALSFQKKYPEKILLVRYEDMVYESELAISRIYNFLGVEAIGVKETEIPVPENINDFLVQKRDEERMIKKYSDLSKPINTERVESWKKELSADEIALCDRICGDFAKQFGYTKHTFRPDERPSPRKHLAETLNAVFNIEKDLLIYYLPIAYKMKRFIRRQKILGFIRDKS